MFEECLDICECCGNSFNDDYVYSCAECGRSICADCAVGSREEMMKDAINEEDELKPEFCPYCTGEVVDKSDLLEFALQKLNVTIEELETEFRKGKGYELRFDT